MSSCLSWARVARSGDGLVAFLGAALLAVLRGAAFFVAPSPEVSPAVVLLLVAFLVARRGPPEPVDAWGRALVRRVVGAVRGVGPAAR